MTIRDRLRAAVSRISLRARVLLVLGLALVGFSVSAAVQLDQLDRIGRSAALTTEVWLPMARIAARLESQVERGAVERVRQSLDTAWTLTDREVNDPEERAALSAARTQVTEITRAVDAWPASPVATDREEAAAEVRQLITLADTRVEAVSRRTARAQAAARRIALITLGGLPLLGLLLWHLAGRALAPLRRLGENARRLAAGEVADFATTGVDEVGTLGRTLGQMAAAVAERDQNLQALTRYLRRVLDTITVAVVVAEAGAVRMANPAAKHLWGLSAGDPLPDSLASLADGRHEERPNEGRFEDVVVQPFDADARIFVGEDVTVPRQDRDRLQRSERLAVIGQLMAQITHEVRNPLNAISLHAELLTEEPLSEEGRALLGTITREIARLDAVTERYLDLARRRAPEVGPEDPVALTEQVVGLLDEVLRRAGTDVVVEGVASGPVGFAGSVARQALLNLLRNAAEAGAHHVVVRVRTHPELTWEIADDGPGIDHTTLAHIFEPFFSTRARGTGLGLPISQEAVVDAGGRLTVESTVGVGTVFQLVLPSRQLVAEQTS